MALSRLSIRRPVATSMLFVAIGVLGVVSFARLPIDLLPDVSFPTLSVWTEYPDAGPAEVERLVTEQVESVLSRVPGARSIDSRSREGQSLVRLQFYWGTDMEFAMLHVRERLDNLSASLPESAERPVILTSDPTNEPIMSLAVTGAPLGDLRDLADAVFKRRLEQLDGVALAAITGDPEREIQVEVDAGLLAAHGVTMGEVTSALDAANYSAPGGTIRRGRFRFSLRTLGEFRSVADLGEVTIARPEQGGVVRLHDVATVREGEAERETIARFNGEPAIGLLVYKESGSNTVRVANQVDEVLAQLAAEFPDVTIDVASNQATFISDAISNVVSALVLGGLLAFVVLFLFLGDPRYPVAIGLSIPISVLAAFSLCYLFDVSLNVMSLGGLALGVGMLVDNSIVVLENIFRHRGERQLAADASAAIGASEVAGAITASTLTTIAVFGPVLYVEGVAGALFADLSLAVAFSLLASLLVALTLLPVMAARFAGFGFSGAPAADAGVPDAEAVPGARSRIARVWYVVRSVPGYAGRGARFVVRSVRLTFGDVGQAVGRTTGRLARPGLEAFNRGFARFAERYERTLEWALEHRAGVVGIAIGSLVLAALVGMTLPLGLMPEVDEGSFRVELTLPVGTPLEETSTVAERLEAGLDELDGVEAVFTRVGRARDAELATRDLSGLNSAALEVRLASGADDRTVIEAFRASLPALNVDPQSVSVERGRATSLGRALGTGNADLAVRIRGDELDSLIAVAEVVAARMEGVGRIADPRIDLQLVQPELEIEVDRAAVARFGFTVREVADAIESYLRGVETSRPYTEFSTKIDIRVTLPEADRSRLADVLALRHQGVPIGELVNVSEGLGPVEVRRLDQNRTVQVLADVRSGGLGRAVADVEAAVEDIRLPALTALTVGGQNEEMRESFRSLGFAFSLALFLVFLILAAQFESIIQPVVVLAAVPLALIGAVLALGIAGAGINAMSGIGMVILIGIVVNDAIIKVDFINQQRAAGATKRVAILEAGRLRLRPIVMTTVTTVLGLTPMALGWGAGA
ncbi:MAG TPA: efflux RND transporter permease subunit, partial [Gemmatimonadota bacterium]|nr:efflux RND transporter permease subunit [Gemmatimonadota bacterium]